jgi:hypothetical protein
MQGKVPCCDKRLADRDERPLIEACMGALPFATIAHPMKKHLWKVILFLIVVLTIGGYVRYFWVFGTGAKSGELNYIVHKGVLFKTYEGKLVQTGIRSQYGTFESLEFLFSVEDPAVAEQLMTHSGNQFNLHYREYLAALPWRGHTKYVVDSIISMDKMDR